MFAPFAVITAVAASTVATPNPANDICLAMIPPKLVAELTRQHPDYALPRLTDAPVERLMAIANSGAWPCPFVAIVDFDGDGNLDRAVALKHNSEPAIRVIAARHVHDAWQIEVLKDWPIALTGAVVAPLEAGLYEQTKAGANIAAELDNIKSIQSDQPGFVAGADEGAQTAFFYVNGSWQQIWMAD